MWQEPTYNDEGIDPPGFCHKLVSKISFGVFCPIEHGEKKMLPVREKSVYGASTILLDFHTCHLLLGTAVKMQQSKDQMGSITVAAPPSHFWKPAGRPSASVIRGWSASELRAQPQRSTLVPLFDHVWKPAGSYRVVCL